MLVYFIVKMVILKCGFLISFIFSIMDLIKHAKIRYDIYCILAVGVLYRQCSKIFRCASRNKTSCF